MTYNSQGQDEVCSHGNWTHNKVNSYGKPVSCKKALKYLKETMKAGLVERALEGSLIKRRNKINKLPTLLELLENKLKYAGPRDKTVTIKIAINTARMMLENEKLPSVEDKKD